MLQILHIVVVVAIGDECNCRLGLVLTSGASNSARYWRRASSRSCNLETSQVPPTTVQPMLSSDVIAIGAADARSSRKVFSSRPSLDCDGSP
jgi:hypothetical protein